MTQSDDDVLATRDWCVQEGLSCGYQFTIKDRWIPEIFGIRQYVRLPDDATRGDVRMLIKVLRIEQKTRA